MKMTFGYLYDFRNPAPWRRPWRDVYAETLEFIGWTERLGFGGAWVPEHHGADDGYIPSPFIALTAIAARTQTINLGAGIALAPLYHPVRFAEDCTVLDILSNGRLEMGLAVGYREWEAKAFGVDFGSRGRRMDEFLPLVRRLWAGEKVTHRGEFFKLEQACITPLPARGGLPLYLGGFADKAVERAAKYGDGYFGNMELCDLYLEKLRQFGKDPGAARIRIQGLFLVVAQDPERAMHELAPYFHYVNNSYGRWAYEDRRSLGFGDAVTLKEATLEEFIASGTLKILTPGQAIDKFNRMLAKAPIEHFTMMLPAGFPPSKFADYAEVFAREVMPAFR